MFYNSFLNIHTFMNHAVLKGRMSEHPQEKIPALEWDGCKHQSVNA